MKEIKSTQLHPFSNASQQGYGAISCIRIEDIGGNVECWFLMGKSRPAPIKPDHDWSCQQQLFLQNWIKCQEASQPIDQTFFWTDSTYILRYIENTCK